MPATNSIKEYLKNGIYHVYNRGVSKQPIFLDEKDYAMFLFYLKLYLDNPESLKNLDPQKRTYLSRKNFYGQIDFLCYCLMPNHFHLLLKQRDKKGVASFMRCITTNYSMYFNKRYKRVGTLFQGRYRAVLIKKDSYLLHLSRYIHLNPINKQTKGQSLGDKNNVDIEKYPYSSYTNYIGNKNTRWVNSKIILDYFKTSEDKDIINKSSYKKFTKSPKCDSKGLLDNLVLEDD